MLKIIALVIQIQQGTIVSLKVRLSRSFIHFENEKRKGALFKSPFSERVTTSYKKLANCRFFLLHGDVGTIASEVQ